jgi:hypothetical protein
VSETDQNDAEGLRADHRGCYRCVARAPAAPPMLTPRVKWMLPHIRGRSLLGTRPFRSSSLSILSFIKITVDPALIW